MVEVESRTARASHSGRLALIWALSRQRITYLLAGAITAVVYCALLGLGLLAAEDAVPYLFLVLVSHLITVVLVYPGYRLVVFRGSGGSWIKGYLRFYAVGLSFLGASLAGLPLLVEIVHIPIMIAQCLIVIASPPISYAINRMWTFR
jgi:putative flippase GtrA